MYFFNWNILQDFGDWISFPHFPTKQTKRQSSQHDMLDQIGGLNIINNNVTTLGVITSYPRAAYLYLRWFRFELIW